MKMVSEDKYKLYIERAKNELDLANAVFKLSSDSKIKIELELKENATFFSNVISCSYYTIFYATKSLLKQYKITTKIPSK